MSWHSVIAATLGASFDLYDEFVSDLEEAALVEKLPGLPSNTIGQQLWCVVGARESYQRAIGAGEWAGFSCSLSTKDLARTEPIVEALAGSAQTALNSLETATDGSDVQRQLVLDLLEHEAAHQGQLIRYLYALGLIIPAGWKSRYALD